MTKKDRKTIVETIDNEGFDYTFINYSTFDKIKDEEFHKLRQAYVDAQKALAKFLEVED